MLVNKALFWDFDSTLIYPNESFADAFYCTLLKYVCTVGWESVCKFMHSACSWYTPEVSYTDSTGEKWWQMLFKKFKGFYSENQIQPNEMMNIFFKRKILECANYKTYHDAAYTLSASIEMGYKNYILSNNYPELPEVVKGLHLSQYFAGYVVSSRIGYEKPREEIFEYARELAGKPDFCCMIGDNPVADIEGARKSGFHTILVHKTKGEAGGGWFAENLADIIPLL